MTADPKRWLEDEGTAIERELLASVSDVRPPAQAKHQAWHGIAASIAAGTVAASIAPAAAAATSKVGSTIAASTLLTKAVWTVAAGSIAVGGYFAAREAWPKAPEPERGARAAEVAAPVEAPESVAAPEAAAPEAAPIEAREPEARRAGPRPAKRRDPLAEESALLTRARAALRTGDTAGAEQMLQRMGAEFPRGVLEQERQVLSIEVLAARGDTEAAKARAREFAKAHPTSPHTARLRSLLDTPR